MPALSCDPTSVLVLADWAREAGHSLCAAEGQAIPNGRPKEQRYEWRAYLRNWFEDPSVLEAFEFLRWPLHEVLAAPREATPEVTTTEAGGDWFESSQHLAF